MLTEMRTIAPDAPDPETLAYAAEILRRGGLVAFPTETVYGLGANALDAEAVERIFAAKGRPATNPVIVHVADCAAARALTTAWTEEAEKLATRFWAGPLTLVLPKRDCIPDAVTAGGSTVAVRVPAHPVAQGLIRAAGSPIAAPSANRSERLSPTRAEHVLRSLDGRIDLILDGGATTGGLESTVLHLGERPPRLLRPGLISPAEIEAVIGAIQRRPAFADSAAPLPSPGMLARHYAPRAPLELTADGWNRVQERLHAGARVGWLTLAPPPAAETIPNLVLRRMPQDAAAYAAQLYATLHELDRLGVERIVVDTPPEAEDWLAVRDRLQRAAVASPDSRP